MAKHFIYTDDIDKDGLYQGDLLKRTPDLLDVLSKFHRHYADKENYKYFIVLTQSCDLIRRNGKTSSSPYITIAAVRPLNEALRREAKEYQDWWQQPKNIIDSKARERLDNFTFSLLNNNVPNYFYLHEDISLGISERCCAFLALAVAIRSEHYEKCLKAKTAQLKEDFSIKLGWLVGNMYSRVGTKEWDEHYGKGQAEKEMSDILKETFITFSKDKIKKGTDELQRQKELTQYSPDEIYNHIMETELIPKSTEFSKRAEQILKEKFPSKEKEIHKVIATLMQDPVIKNILS
jgi:hypothetical protein